VKAYENHPACLIFSRSRSAFVSARFAKRRSGPLNRWGHPRRITVSLISGAGWGSVRVPSRSPQPPGRAVMTSRCPAGSSPVCSSSRTRKAMRSWRTQLSPPPRGAWPRRAAGEARRRASAAVAVRRIS